MTRPARATGSARPVDGLLDAIARLTDAVRGAAHVVGEPRSVPALAGVPAPPPGSWPELIWRVDAEEPATTLPRGLPVPSPSPAYDDVTHLEGEAAVALALVRRAQAGDAQAFGQLYDRYVDLVHRYVAFRVPDPQLAEDLTSETFLRALRRIGSFHWQGRDVGAWFVTIARHLVADHYRSGRYRLELTADDVALVAGAGEQLVQDGPEGAVLAALDARLLLEAVTRLGADQQECVVLRFLQGLSLAETALVMGRSKGSVKALQYRAVRALARTLPRGALR